jgi:starch synthase
LFLLRELHPEFSHLKKIHTAFTIHNLAIQGTRPIRAPEAGSGHASSVEHWFPELFHDVQWIEQWKDPRYHVPCFTPMAAGIQHADKINTVSPTYAEEILKPSDHTTGYYGGEGLELLLQETTAEHRLFGILNGCEYPKRRAVSRITFDKLCDLMHSQAGTLTWKQHPEYAQLLSTRITLLRESAPSFIMTVVTRIVDQKVKLFFENDGKGSSAIEHVMKNAAVNNGVLIILGSGTPDYEEKFFDTFCSHERMIFFRGYAEKVAQALYAGGTMFLMPSSFEPCGISQMLAMRDGQPCIVHAVGGLNDTIQDEVNGFTFDGKTPAQQADRFMKTVERAIRIFLHDAVRWKNIVNAASSARFTWEKSAKEYDELMYR